MAAQDAQAKEKTIPLRRARKLAALLRRPEYRSALRYRVAAGLEHEVVAFNADFGTIIDVGANTGQFALFATANFPRARIESFEPMPGPRARLERVLARHKRVRVYDVAAGATNGTAEFHVSASIDSSSLLAPTGLMAAIFPGTEETTVVEVTVQRLDEAIATPIDRPSLLKIDVQGGELGVLRGATGLLDQIDQVYVECSFLELYAGQALAGEVVAFLVDAGFSLDGFFNLTTDRDANCVQADFLFRRRDRADTTS